MTRSFAVREVALGVGALLAIRGHDDGHQVRFWAGLGTLVDIGDLATALTSQEQANAVPAALAVVGLSAELWAFSAAKTTL